MGTSLWYNLQNACFYYSDCPKLTHLYPYCTCEASWVKTASKVNIFGAVAEVERVQVGGSQKVSCFLWASTLRKDMDSEVSRDPLAGHIRTITFTCKAHSYIQIIIILLHNFICDKRLLNWQLFDYNCTLLPANSHNYWVVCCKNNVFQFSGQGLPSYWQLGKHVISGRWMLRFPKPFCSQKGTSCCKVWLDSQNRPAMFWPDTSNQNETDHPSINIKEHNCFQHWW